MAKKQAATGRKIYTQEEKNKILADAKENSLSATAVKEKYGVSTATFYSWSRNGTTRNKRGSNKHITVQLGDGVSLMIDRTTINDAIKKLFVESM